jgi:hypothetical protein
MRFHKWMEHDFRPAMRFSRRQMMALPKDQVADETNFHQAAVIF